MSDENVIQVENENEGEATNTTKKLGAAVILESGERRLDYIRRRFAEGATRSAIAKELDVAYQIVFAATKVKKPKQDVEDVTVAVDDADTAAETYP